MSLSDNQTCKQDDCFVPQTSCAKGHMDPSKCPHFVAPNAIVAMGAFRTEDDELFPWTGRPLGLIDLRFVSATRRPHLVGIAGAADAGKTTLLCLLFLAIYRGRRIGPHTFSGSFTLQGWENIARHLQLNAGETIKFPPHTSQNGRVPGLLHLGLSDDDRNRMDVLLADASGEWFSAWTDKPTSEKAAGARWTADHSDKLLIAADTDALMGKKGGVSRRELEFLIRRIASDFGTEGVALVWTKNDLPRDAELSNTIEDLFRSCFKDGPVFAIGVPEQENPDPDKTLQELEVIFSWAFEPRSRTISLTRPDHAAFDPFMAYRDAS